MHDSVHRVVQQLRPSKPRSVHHNRKQSAAVFSALVVREGVVLGCGHVVDADTGPERDVPALMETGGGISE